MSKSDIEITKRPNAKSSYTEDSLTDLILCIEDPHYFMRKFVKIQHPMRGALPFEPYPYQVDLLDGFHENRFCIALTARQMGKSVTSNTLLNKDGREVQIGQLIMRTRREKLVDWLERKLVQLST